MPIRSLVLSEWWSRRLFRRSLYRVILLAYKALSAGFITDPSHSDAFMLLAETVGPAALHMLSAMQRHHTHRPLIKPATASCSEYLRSSAQIESSSRSSTVNVLHTSNAEMSQQLAV